MTLELTLEERLQIQLVTLERRADKYAYRGESDYPRLVSLQKRIRDLRTLLMNHRDEEVTRAVMATPIDDLVRRYRPAKVVEPPKPPARPHPSIELHDRTCQVLNDTLHRIDTALTVMSARRYEGDDPFNAADMLARFDLVTGLIRTAGGDVPPSYPNVERTRQWVSKQLNIRRGIVYLPGGVRTTPVPPVVVEAEPASEAVVERVRRVDILAALREELANHQRAASLTRPSAPLSYLVSLSARLNELGHIVARFDNKEWQRDTTFDHRIRTLEDKYEQMDAAVKNLVSLEEQDRFVAESMLSDPERFETWHIARVEARLTLIDATLTNMTARPTRDNPLSKLLNVRSYEDRTLKGSDKRVGFYDHGLAWARKELTLLSEAADRVAQSGQIADYYHAYSLCQKVFLLTCVLAEFRSGDVPAPPESVLKLYDMVSAETTLLQKKVAAPVAPAVQDGPVPRELNFRINGLMREIETTSVEYRHLLEPRLVELLTLREAINDRGPPELDVEEKGLATQVSDELVAAINQRTALESSHDRSAEFRKSVRRVVNELLSEERRPGGLVRRREI